jgi:glyoxylase-like metal-dependent hydrolase (beta-lactamase superfamily II)
VIVPTSLHERAKTVKNESSSLGTPIRIELPFRPDSVNVYLFREPEPILIDAGFNSTANWEALIAGLAEYGCAPSDLKKVIITHPHVDHYGLAHRVADTSNAHFYIGHTAVNYMTASNPQWGHKIQYYREVLLPGMGLPDNIVQAIAIGVNRNTYNNQGIPATRLTGYGEGDIFELGGLAWMTMHLPGHDGAQMCFYQPETRQLISGDMLLAKTPTPVTDVPDEGKPRDPSLPRFMKSLDRLETLDIDVVYPGHGPLFWNHREVIQAQRIRIHARKEECFGLLESGHKTIASLLAPMYPFLPLEHGLVGLWMILGYLDLLVQEGRVVVEEVNKAWVYRTV